jgi:hypothetical protein
MTQGSRGQTLAPKRDADARSQNRLQDCRPAGDVQLSRLKGDVGQCGGGFPIERIWKLTRRRCLHNRYFARLEEVIAAVEGEFRGWVGRNETLRRLCAII